MIYICNFHVLSHLLLIYICKLHWNLNTMFVCHPEGWTIQVYRDGEFEGEDSKESEEGSSSSVYTSPDGARYFSLPEAMIAAKKNEDRRSRG
jgi:hypothetical protein